MNQEQETCSIHMFMRLYKTNRKLLHFLVKLDLNSLFLFVTRSCIWVALYWIIFNISFGTFCFSVTLYSNRNEYSLENTAVSQCSLPVPCSSTSRQKLWVVKHPFSFFGRHSFMFASQLSCTQKIIYFYGVHLFLWHFLVPFAIINIESSIAIHCQKQPLLRAPATNMWSSLWFDMRLYFLVNKIGWRVCSTYYSFCWSVWLFEVQLI